MRHRSVLAALALALAVVGTTAWTNADPSQPRDRIVRSIVVRAGHCSPGTAIRLGRPGFALAAVVRRRLVVYRAPGRDGFARFGRLNVNGVPTVFSIRAAIFDRACRATWYRVQVPLRPNGVVGYVRALAVDVGRVRSRIEVDLSRRTLTYYRRGRVLVRTRVAVGAPATPTPIGRFYVNQRLTTTDRSGPFGPGALGISAFSNVLTGWVQGGPIAIHGTNAPWSIGRAVSNGCIRVRNGVLERLFAATPAGTPVTVHP
jgi:lipoprotein-anchoring transpeptidase ErfK/SrfK